MANQSENQHAGDWLKWEQDNLFSREKVTLVADANDDLHYESGTVLGKLTSGGKYLALTEGPSDGSQTPAAILLLETTVPEDTDVEATVIVRDAIVSRNGLTWPSTYDDTNKDSAAATLASAGILVRDGA